MTVVVTVALAVAVLEQRRRYKSVRRQHMAALRVAAGYAERAEAAEAHLGEFLNLDQLPGVAA